jgi:hypothetical protein
LGFYIEVEELAVHCAADQPRRIKPVVAQVGNGGLGLMLMSA